ncbi:MAG: alpha/beta fold hydrolase [Maricaulaceae bacterium]
MPENITFMPPLWMRPSMVQTGLASLKFRKKGRTALEAASREDILCTPEGVKLKAVISEPTSDTSPIVIFIHGWEGSSDSTYVISAARRVYGRGVGVVRLNLRDHGNTHNLNEGAFYATLFDEVFDSVKMICERYEKRPVILVGFSLGGNYVLRVARRLAKVGIGNLDHILAVSPVIDPASSNPSLDDNKLIRSYFLRKWKRSMRLKQAAFPDIYDFSDVLGMTDIMKMTDITITRFTDYPDAMTYFASYSIAPDDLKDCPTALRIIAAKDDPVVPMRFCESLNLNDKAHLYMWDHGGHNGFFHSLTGPTGYDVVLGQILDGYCS